MVKPRIIIADMDINYIMPIQLRFVEDFFEKVELEIITDKSFFDEVFSTPQKIDILIVSEDFYNQSIHRHNIGNIFVMTEKHEKSENVDVNVNVIFKYTSIKEFFNEIISKSSSVLKFDKTINQETKVILFYSANGGTGKTTVAMGVSASLSKNYKHVLYINASYLQIFQYMLENYYVITERDVYTKLACGDDNIYSEIKHVIRREGFDYIPPFKASLASLNLNYSVFSKIISSAKKSGDYDFIIVDADVTFNEEKAILLTLADKVFIVVNQTLNSIYATNVLISNISGVHSDKYAFICNNFNEKMNNMLISGDVLLEFAVDDYINHFENYCNMKPADFAEENGIQRIAFSII